MMTRWWKCDLQIATPAWKFTVPAGSSFDFSSPDGRRTFCDQYMAAIKAKSVDVVALADHNSFEWIDEMKAAGDRAGVIVFPGCEVTTGSGADGIHLVVIGDLAKTSHDVDLLLAGPLGFDADHARFHDVAGERAPGSSSKTVLQLLEGLPDDYLVVAPHVLSHNGLASENTARGDIRWRALHHPRLNAIDPGNCGDPQGDSFNARFRRRELKHFPRLPELAFIATSDAYSFDDVGSRFCWIRMGKPGLEGLRQAFLDPAARIICDWDPRLKSYPEQNPNNVQHAWIEKLSLTGVLGNSASTLDLTLHPGLNILIGGRGSGKSTVVAAIRQLYSGVESLPEKVRLEAEEFVERAFSIATLQSSHRISVSQEKQIAKWSRQTGQITVKEGGSTVRTSFKVRVINQKELFERVAGERSGSFAASRSLLALIDEALGVTATPTAPTGTWSHRAQNAKDDWLAAVRVEAQLATDVAQLPSLRARIKELENQVAAFASPEVKTRLSRHRKRQAEREELRAKADDVLEVLTNTAVPLESVGDLTLDSARIDEQFRAELEGYAAELQGLIQSVKPAVLKLLTEAKVGVAQWATKTEQGQWFKDLLVAEQHFQEYTKQLAERGIDASGVALLEKELGEKQRQIVLLEKKEQELQQAKQQTADAWTRLLEVYGERRAKRSGLLGSVQSRSGRLKFDIERFRDDEGWARHIRDLLNIRADGFLEDVPALSNWIWGQEEATRNERWQLWNQSLVNGNFQELQARSGLRQQWMTRLATTDISIRLRLATEIAEDVVTMRFLRDGGNPEVLTDWQVVTEGSPGQRTAAMLGLVLHFGSEPLILDQPEDDLDSEWITGLLVKELRASRWSRQIVIASHNANLPVNGDAEQIIALENANGSLQVRATTQELKGKKTSIRHEGPIEYELVRKDIQNIMEGGVIAFIQREKKYNNELRIERQKTQ